MVARKAPPSGRPDVKGVFISYRRGETSGQARALHEQLEARYGEQRVFMDVDSIVAGEDFAEAIDRAIQSCAVVLALIGRDWARRPGVDELLLGRDDDFVRGEVQSALDLGVPVIPILVERTPMPTAADLPEDLRPLLRRNALELENARWDADVDRLMRAIEAHVAKRDEPEQSPPASSRRRPLALGAVVAVVAAIAVVVALVAGGGGGGALRPTSQVSKAAPERLVSALLATPMTSAELPRGLLQSSAALVNQLSTTSAGVVGDVGYVFSGPDIDDWGYYVVFSNGSNAQAAWSAGDSPYSTPSVVSGTFSDNQLADTTRCLRWRARASGQVASECEVLSGDVISFADAVPIAGSNGDDAIARSLIAALVGHLARTAGRVAASPAAQNRLSPPFLVSALLTDNFAPSEVQSGFTVGRTYPIAPYNPPAGFLREVETDFSESGTENTGAEQYWVFDTPADAQSWYGTGRQLSGDRVTSTFGLSGFPEPTDCTTYILRTSPPDVATCYSLSGNVVTQGFSRFTASAGGSVRAAVFDRAALVRLSRLRSQGS
jgi:TIR domain